MKRSLLVALFLITISLVKGQQNAVFIPNDTTALDTKAFAQYILAGANDNYSKAKTLLNWLSTHFEWKYTDCELLTHAGAMSGLLNPYAQLHSSR
jgi:hypothetical protein